MNACTVSEMERIVGIIAPYELAEEWDNVGLLFGRSEAEVTRVLVALDLTQAVLDEARALGAQLIVAHHPILFHARKHVTDRDREGRLMLDMARADVALIAAHTNLDSAPGGVNDVLMEAMGCTQVSGEGAVRVGWFETEMTLAACVSVRVSGCTRRYAPMAQRIRPCTCWVLLRRRGIGAFPCGFDGCGLLHHRGNSPP